MRSRGWVWPAVLFACALAACSPQATEFGAQHAPTDTIRLGGAEVRVYVANESAEWSQGLQGYDGLAEGEGMLFIFDDVASRTFAMKDVSFPIDVVFFDENLAVSAVVPLNPGDTQLAGSPSPSAYVLELPQGWARDNGIVLGDSFEVVE